MESIIITKRNYVHLRETDQIKATEDFFGPSMTVPDQTMSLRTLLDRHSRGMPLPAAQMEGFYDEDGDGVDFDALDIVDQRAYVQAKREEYLAIKDKYEAEQADLRAKLKANQNKDASANGGEPVTKEKGEQPGKEGDA